MAGSIEVKDVSYQYEVVGRAPVLAVGDVSFAVPESLFLCILGSSGCRKTTILNMLAGFLSPTSKLPDWDKMLSIPCC